MLLKHHYGHIAFAFLLNLFSISQCMLTQWKYPPTIQPHIPELIQMRLMGREMLYTDLNITVEGYATPEQKNWKCFDLAIERTTGFNGGLNFYSGSNYLTTFPIEKYFEQTQHPKKNDLIVYTTSEHDLTINHFAVAINNTTVESKWGKYSEILHHHPFAVPQHYGNAIGAFTLKKEFKNKEGRAALLKSIRQDKAEKLFAELIVLSVATITPLLIIVHLLCSYHILCIW